jgi:beta-phosphoglucomutase-like phosphatase (HAD superfamily)
VSAATALTAVDSLRAFLGATGPFDVAVWDFDGVIGDTEPAQAQVYRDMLSERGVLVEDDFFRDLAGRSEPEIWAALQDRYGIGGEVAGLRRERIARIAPLLAESVTPNWFVRPAILALREMNTRSIIISSGNEEVVDRYLERWGLRALFDGVSAISGDSDDRPKRERLRDALAGAGRTLVIEDSADYLRLASELGAVTLGVKHTLNGEAAEFATAILLSETEPVA